MKHTSKPREKSVKPAETRQCKSDEIVIEARPKPGEGTLTISDDKMKAATPGKLLDFVLFCLFVFRINGIKNRYM